MTRLKTLLVAGWALGAFLPPVTAAEKTAPVQTDKGPVTGLVAEGVAAYKGIPFAAPPVGALRWKAPQPPAAWTAPFAAEEYAHDCMQLPFPSDAAPLGTPPAEDCLYLNVWTPAKPAGKALPVMVWIHGGGFVNGGSSPAVYDGSAFARRGIVFVSMNYRLGRFGFFAHPALRAETPKGPLGNYAFLDQIAALHWVKTNAAAFGGDPANVTIFGESAGGGSVNTLMISGLAKGLFHKAICESGGGRSRGPISTRHITEAGTGPQGRPSAEAVGVAFAEKAGVARGEGAAVLAALRALPADKVVDGMNLINMGQQQDTYSGPMVDGAIVPEEAEPAFRAGRQAKVPYMVGANDREFGFFRPPAEQAAAMFAPFGADKEKALEAYDPGGKDASEAAVQLMSDQAMVEPARLLARLTAPVQPTYAYRFSYVASSLRAKEKGALHATEIPFVFSTVKAKYEAAATAEDVAMGEAMTAYWAGFARTGDPNGDGRPRWPVYTAAKDEILDFTAAGPKAGPDPRRKRLDFVDRLASSPPKP
ncbi:MAG: carboxylesterase family protein [Vicinamibacteria bacterium]